MSGTSTFPVEVTNVSRHGLWLLIGDEELLLPFEHFPWFRDASIGKISVVELSLLGRCGDLDFQGIAQPAHDLVP